MRSEQLSNHRLTTRSTSRRLRTVFVMSYRFFSVPNCKNSSRFDQIIQRKRMPTSCRPNLLIEPTNHQVKLMPISCTSELLAVAQQQLDVCGLRSRLLMAAFPSTGMHYAPKDSPEN